MEALTLKLVCIPLILLLNALFGAVPYALIRRRERLSGASLHQSPRLTRGLSLASCFSAGVFLATCFVGLLPSVEAKFRRVTRSLGGSVSYPVPEVTVCAGFFAVWLLEQLLHKCVHSACGGEHGLEAPRQALSGENLLEDEEAEEEEEHPLSAVEAGHSHLPVAHGNSALRSILLTFALGSHSVLEGVGFGLMDGLAQVLNMALAIAIHESLCALSLGLQLAHQKTRPCLVYGLIATFAALIPVGIGVGLSLEASEASVSGQVATLVLQGMAAGTFIYVVFFEILPPAMGGARDRVLKAVCTAAGFSLIAAIRAFTRQE